MSDKKTSQETPATALTANTILPVVDLDEALPGDRNKKISASDFFGGTSGIPFYFGINTAPAYPIHVLTTMDNARLQLDYSGGVSTLVSSTSTYGFSGTTSGHNYRLIAGGSYRLEIDTAGILYAPYLPTNDLAGDPGLTAVYMNASGELGYSSSMTQNKSDIVDITASDAIDKLTSLRPVNYKIGKGNASSLGFLAEEVYAILPEAVPLQVFIKDQDSYQFIKPDEVANIAEIRTGLTPNAVETRTAQMITESKDGIIKTEERSLDVELHPAGVNNDTIVPLLVAAMQNLIERINILEGK